MDASNTPPELITTLIVNEVNESGGRVSNRKQPEKDVFEEEEETTAAATGSPTTTVASAAAAEGTAETGILSTTAPPSPPPPAAAATSTTSAGSPESSGGSPTATIINDIVLPDDVIPINCPAMDDSNRMRVTTRELNIIREIRNAVEGIPEIDDLTDFWYSQIGVIICSSNHPKPMENALYRIIGMQLFKQRYGITDTLGEAIRAMEWMIDMFPDLFLSWELGNRPDGIIVGCWKGMEFFGLLDTPDKVNKFLVGMYYFEHAMSFDLYTIRKGPICAWNCDKFGFSWMFRKILMRCGTDLIAFYPDCPYNQCYKTNTFYNICIAMFKRLVAKEFSDHIEVGLVPSPQLEAIFNNPDPPNPTENVLPYIVHCLTKRFEHEKTFVIPRNTSNQPEQDSDILG